MRREDQRILVGIVGASGLGKTTFLERLIPLLASQGLRIGAVKHASHGFLADRPGKDSYRLYESGAEGVALVSDEQMALFVRRTTGEDRALQAALAALPGDLDVVVVEGFSWEPIPRVVLVSEAEMPSNEHLRGGEVLRIVRIPTALESRERAFADALSSLASQIVGAWRAANPHRDLPAALKGVARGAVTASARWPEAEKVTPVPRWEEGE